MQAERCHDAVMAACSACGQDNPEIARFCLACGASLAEEAPHREERRIVSVVFVDLVGFTSRSEQLDPEDVRAILTRTTERCATSSNPSAVSWRSSWAMP
jgi:hypothetical protein